MTTIEEIRLLQEELGLAIVNNAISEEELLARSRVLDEMINQYYREEQLESECNGI